MFQLQIVVFQELFNFFFFFLNAALDSIEDRVKTQVRVHVCKNLAVAVIVQTMKIMTKKKGRIVSQVCTVLDTGCTTRTAQRS